MIKSISNLPAKQRRDIRFVKNCLAKTGFPLSIKPVEFLWSLKESGILNTFKQIFTNGKISKTLGFNLAALFLSTSLMRFPFEETTVSENDFVEKAPFVLEIKKSVQFPIKDIKITQGYKLFHPGIDFDGITGDPINPIMDGTIEAINYSAYAYGNAVLINHGNNISSLYAHLSKILVAPNQEVTTDTIIGEMGATGRSFGDHLHLEVRNSGKPTNPLTILPK